MGKLTKAIFDINFMDLWIGVVSEDSLRGGNLGEVGAAIVAETFKRLRDGDRFWYAQAYPSEEVEEI